MTFTLELTPAQEARLREEAARAGMEPAALLIARAGLGEQEADTDAAERLSRFQKWHRQWEQSLPVPRDGQEWQEEAERFRLWADSHAQKGPGLSLDDLSRESIYGEHG